MAGYAVDVRSRLDGALIIIAYRRLRVLGTIGRLDMALEDARELYKSSWELAPVQKSPERDFLAAFCLEPPIDITLARYPADASIVTYSLDETASRMAIAGIVRDTGFVPYPPFDSFAEILRRETEDVETQTYAMCERAAGLLQADFEKVFAAIRYGNFLFQYHRGLFSHDESSRKAMEQFGLPRIL